MHARYRQNQMLCHKQPATRLLTTKHLSKAGACSRLVCQGHTLLADSNWEAAHLAPPPLPSTGNSES